jgi:hypothetical protein
MNDILEKHKELCDRIHNTCVAKNHDYGNSASDLYKKFGLISYIVRMNDKMNRINTLIKREAEVKDEKITDTLLDLANYCLLAVADMELDKNGNGKGN